MAKQVRAVYPHRYNKVDYEQGQVYEIEEEDYQKFIDFSLIKDAVILEVKAKEVKAKEPKVKIVTEEVKQ